jgi:ubiquinone biosynthesis protein
MPTDFTMVFKAIVTTEGLAKSIAPDVDPIELARPFIEQMVAERYSPDRLKQTALADFHMLSRVLRSLPQQLPAILSDIQEGKIAVGIAPTTLRLQEEAERARQRRALRVAVSATCLLCGTYALSLNLPGFASLGIPYVSAFFYAAALGGLTVARWR